METHAKGCRLGGFRMRASMAGLCAALVTIIGVALWAVPSAASATSGSAAPTSAGPACRVELETTATSASATVVSGCTGGGYYLISYKAQSDIRSLSNPQTLWAFTASAPYTVPLPPCYWQIDFEQRSDPPPPHPSASEAFIAGELGGHACTGPTTTTTQPPQTTTTVGTNPTTMPTTSATTAPPSTPTTAPPAGTTTTTVRGTTSAADGGGGSMAGAGPFPQAGGGVSAGPTASTRAINLVADEQITPSSADLATTGVAVLLEVAFGATAICFGYLAYLWARERRRGPRP